VEYVGPVALDEQTEVVAEVAGVSADMIAALYQQDLLVQVVGQPLREHTARNACSGDQIIILHDTLPWSLSQNGRFAARGAGLGACKYVTPAQAGVHATGFWIPACAGMTS
jgi:hypothetical protein